MAGTAAPPPVIIRGMTLDTVLTVGKIIVIVARAIADIIGVFG